MRHVGLFENLAADDSDARIARRKALAVAHRRVEDRFGAFLAAAKSSQERTARLDHIRSELSTVVAAVCNEYGGDPESVESSILQHLAVGGPPGHPSPMEPFSGPEEAPRDYTQESAEWTPPAEPETIDLEPDWEGVRAWVQQLEQTDPEAAQGIKDAMGNESPDVAYQPGQVPIEDPSQYPLPSESFPQNDEEGRVASTRVARRPKMCPYHREVTDISLAAGDPVAGFNSMAQHAWGPQHCQGNEYEGRCNFKREMVTQTYWDEKAEQAEERRQQREEERAIQQEVEVTEVPDSPEGLESTDPVEEPGINEELAEAPSAVADGPAIEEVGEPMPMAASVKEAEALETVDVTKGSENDPSPKINRDKLPEGGLEEVDAEMEGSPHPTVRIDPLEPIIPENNEADFLEGTKAVTEKQDVDQESSFDGNKADSGSWGGNNGASPVASVQKEALTAKDFKLVADAIAKFPGADKEELAQHFAQYLAQTNPNFDFERFLQAAIGEPATGRDVYQDTPYPEPEHPADAEELRLTGGADPHVNPIRKFFEDGFVPQSTVESAIDEYKENENE